MEPYFAPFIDQKPDDTNQEDHQNNWTEPMEQCRFASIHGSSVSLSVSREIPNGGQGTFFSDRFADLLSADNVAAKKRPQIGG